MHGTWTIRVGMAAAAVCLGLIAPAVAQDAGVKQAAAPPPSPAPAAPEAGFVPPQGGTYMGLPCPPPGMFYPPCPPPCEGPTDNTQFKVPMFHFSADYLYWYPRKSSLPPLVTRGSTVFDPSAALLGNPRTRILLQGTALEDDQLQGLRLTFGVGMDASNEWSLFVTGFALEEGERALTFSRGRTGTDVLARPFFNLAIGTEDADRFAEGGASGGTLTVSQTRRFYGGDVDLRHEYLASENHRVHLLAGVKLLFLEESLDFSRRTQVVATGATTTQVESLGARNRFYGGEIGAEWEFRLGPVFFLTKGKLALGVTEVSPLFTANTQTTTPGAALVNVPGQGLYVSPATAGASKATRFAVAPELNFRTGFDFNEYVRLSVGYTFVGVSEAARAGDVINRSVNPGVLALPAAVRDVAPRATVPTSAFWAQGFDVSVRFSF